jgi:hypothetical protein
MQKRYSVYRLRGVNLSHYKDEQMYERVVHAKKVSGDEAELEVDNEARIPGSDCVALLSRRHPDAMMNVLLWDDQAWTWMRKG